MELFMCRLLLAVMGLRVVAAEFVDMDTPLDKRTTTSLIDGSTYHLVSLCDTVGEHAFRFLN
jgi:hypothetical protein